MSPISSDIQALPIRMRCRRKRALIQRPVHELFLLMQGDGEQRLADKHCWPMRGGDLACFPAGHAHIGNARAGTTCRAWLCFWSPAVQRRLPTLLRRRLPSLTGAGPWRRTLTPTMAATLHTVLRRLGSRSGDELLDDQLRLALLQEVLIQALRAQAASPTSESDDLRQLLARIAEQCEEDWTVARAAAAAGLGRSRFQQRCHALLGCGFTDWLIDRRVDRAIDVLRESALSMEEVAASCGFSSRSAFFRHLRLRSGRSPGAWRNAGC